MANVTFTVLFSGSSIRLARFSSTLDLQTQHCHTAKYFNILNLWTQNRTGKTPDYPSQCYKFYLQLTQKITVQLKLQANINLNLLFFNYNFNQSTSFNLYSILILFWPLVGMTYKVRPEDGTIVLKHVTITKEHEFYIKCVGSF